MASLQPSIDAATLALDDPDSWKSVRNWLLEPRPPATFGPASIRDIRVVIDLLTDFRLARQTSARSMSQSLGSQTREAEDAGEAFGGSWPVSFEASRPARRVIERGDRDDDHVVGIAKDGDEVCDQIDGRIRAAYLVVDEKVAETFEAPTDNPVERLVYAASVLHCLPVGMAESPSVRTGTVMRPATFRTYADQAGFSAVDILPINHDRFRFYRLTA